MTSLGFNQGRTFAAAALIFAVTGFWHYSVDSLIGIHDPWVPSFTSIVLAIGIAGGLAGLALRALMQSAAKERS